MVPAVEESLVKTVDYPIRLPVFEGPLDLLLFLIRRDELDIYDIPIETVTRQYLDVLNRMERMNLEVAGEFFVMAATLMYIKSRMLLPRADQIEDNTEDDADVDPRWELVQQLLEFKKFKEAAADIADLIAQAQDALPRIVTIAEEYKEIRPIKPSDRIELWNAFNAVLRRLSERITVGEIHDEIVSVADRMEFLIEFSTRHPRFAFSELFPEGDRHSLAKMIATFLAVLELTRLKRLAISQDNPFDDLFCTGLAEPERVAGEE